MMCSLCCATRERTSTGAAMTEGRQLTVRRWKARWARWSCCETRALTSTSAAMEGQVGALELLRDAGADLAAADKQGKTPLDVALEKGHEAAAALLRDATNKH